MSQHDFTIAGGAGVGGAAVRGDIEDGLQALASHNKGNSDPATLYENQRWTRGDVPSSSVWTDFVYDGTDKIPKGYVDSTDNVYLVHGAGVPIVPGGRCSLTSGLDKTVSDVTAAAAIYYALSAHDFVPLWDGTRWDNYRFTQLTLALDSDSGHTGYHQSGKNFDLFVYRDSGTLRLCSGPAWTNDTTRADAIARRNGRWVNNASIVLRFGSGAGDTVTAAANTALFVGTFRASANGQTEDSLAKRFVWNTYNRATRSMRVLEATNTWAYSTATIRQANASTANQLDFVRGLDEDEMSADVIASWSNSSAGDGGGVLIGLDSTSAMATGGRAAFVTASTANQAHAVQAAWRGFPGIGRHTLTWLERALAGGGTQTWIGDNNAPTYVQSGIAGVFVG